MGYSLLAAIAGAGLMMSVACHLLSWLGHDPSFGKSVFLLHIGIFVVWIPLVICANRTMPEKARGNVEHLLAELPKWARATVFGIFIYALLNFAFFIYLTHHYPKHKVPFYVELRGFSGHWMLFYGCATAGFVGLKRLAAKRAGEESVTIGPCA